MTCFHRPERKRQPAVSNGSAVDGYFIGAAQPAQPEYRTVIPDVTISEKHYDRLEITEHPVERPTSAGTGFVADHAYRQPSEVIMQIGFAGGGSVLDVVNTAAIGISAGKSPKEIYADLLEIQRNRELLDVVTGKRIYKTC